MAGPWTQSLLCDRGLRARRIDSLHRDAPVQGEIRLQVVVRLPVARGVHLPRSQRDRGLRRGVGIDGGRATPSSVSLGGQGAARRIRRGLDREGLEGMRVGRRLRSEERDRFHALHAADGVVGESQPLALADRNPAAQVRQRKVRDAVSAIESAEKREQRRVLRDRQQLALTESPPLRGEIKWEKGDLTEKGFHALASRLDAAGSVPWWEDSDEADDVVYGLARLPVF